MGLFWHSGRRNYVIANKVRSLKLHLNRDRASSSSEGGLTQAVWVALAVEVCFRGNNEPLCAIPGWREPPWPHTRHPHPVLSALEKFGGKLPRTQWESSVPNRSCQNTSWFSVGHKKSNFPLLKYSFHLYYKPLFPEFIKSINGEFPILVLEMFYFSPMAFGHIRMSLWLLNPTRPWPRYIRYNVRRRPLTIEVYVISGSGGSIVGPKNFLLSKSRRIDYVF